MLVAVLLYLDQYQTGLLQAEVLVLREEAKIYSGALGVGSVRRRSSGRACSGTSRGFSASSACTVVSPSAPA